MKDRILKGWSVRRVLYLALGIWVITQGVITQQYFLLLFGGYFTSMGIFNFGCASGACAYVPPPRNSVRQTSDK